MRVLEDKEPGRVLMGEVIDLDHAGFIVTQKTRRNEGPQDFSQWMTSILPLASAFFEPVSTRITYE